jgi:hypothetical protein
VHYLASQWPKLIRFVDDGRYRPDNNASENAIRPFVVGRRNWLFSDTVVGAHASANLYSLLQTRIANGIDGYRYLCELLAALPRATTVDDFEALLPWASRRCAADVPGGPRRKPPHHNHATHDSRERRGSLTAYCSARGCKVLKTSC